MSIEAPEGQNAEQPQLTEFQQGFIACVLFMNGVTGTPTLEQFEDALSKFTQFVHKNNPGLSTGRH